MNRTSLALVVCGALVQAGCITETVDASGRPVASRSAVKTEGVRIKAPLEPTWFRVRDIVDGMTTEPLQSNGVQRSVRTTIDGAETWVMVEPYDSTHTIVHINSDDPRVKDRIRMQVMRGL